MAMRTVFEASNAIEAHMILHLLQQSGIEARVDGEHLLGAMGELPAMGLVRVVADESDAARAREVISDWERHQREELRKEPTPSRLNGASILLGMAAGAILTSAALLWFERSPRSAQGVDYDGDGIFEEKLIYDDGRLILVEYDRNSDRRRDMFIEYDPDGNPSRAQADDDFNGSFEVRMEYAQGQAATSEVDVDDDGRFDRLYSFRSGALVAGELRDPHTQAVIKRQYFKADRLVRAEYDSDRDGILDIEYRYDFFDEIEGKSRFPPQ